MDESVYRDLLRVTEEIEGLLAHDDNNERLMPLLSKRREIFNQLGDELPEKECAVLIKRIRLSEDKCMALAQDKLGKIKGDLLAMNKGKRAVAAYGKHV